MNTNDKNDDDFDDSNTGTGTSTGGSSGKIQFHYKDLMSGGQRDDQLPLSEITRLLSIHDDRNYADVKKQKQLKEDRLAFKEGRQHTHHYGFTHGGSGGFSPYKPHRTLSEKAQFSTSIDKTVTLTPDNKVDTNKEILDNRLENRPQNRLRHEHTPQYSSPKPRAPGT